jgi:hypothetical protein
MQYIFEIFFKIFVSGRCGTGVMTSPQGDTEEHRETTALLLPVLAVDHPLDSIPEVKHVEVDEQPDSETA